MCFTSSDFGMLESLFIALYFLKYKDNIFYVHVQEVVPFYSKSILPILCERCIFMNSYSRTTKKYFYSVVTSYFYKEILDNTMYYLTTYTH